MNDPPSISEIEPGLFLGNYVSSYDLATLQNHRISAIVSLVAEPLRIWSSPTNRALVPQDRHMWLTCDDSPTQDLLLHMGDICDFIERMRRPDNAARAQGEGPRRVLVHCDQGISRSPTVVIAYLMRRLRADVVDVLAGVREKREVRPNPNFMRQLVVWEKVGYHIWEDEEKTIPKPQYFLFLKRRAADLKAAALAGDGLVRLLSR